MRARHKSYLPTPTMLLALLAFVMLCAGCPHRIVLPDNGQLHRIAKEAEVVVWCRGPGETEWTKCSVRAARGWWLAPPSVVEGE